MEWNEDGQRGEDKRGWGEKMEKKYLVLRRAQGDKGRGSTFVEHDVGSEKVVRLDQ